MAARLGEAPLGELGTRAHETAAELIVPMVRDYHEARIDTREFAWALRAVRMPLLFA